MDTAEISRADRKGPKRPSHVDPNVSTRGMGVRGYWRQRVGHVTKMKPRRTDRVGAGQTGLLRGGAEGIRTPDLLIANETRYQLRHSPLMRQEL